VAVPGALKSRRPLVDKLKEPCTRGGGKSGIPMQVSKFSRRAEVAGSLALGAVAFCVTYMATLNALILISR
jgi:hypothetical protein